MHNNMERKSFLWLLLVVSFTFLWLLKPFFGPIFWAVAITIIFYPVHQRILDRMPQWPNGAALITLLLCVLVVVLPVIFTAASVVNQGVSFYESVQAGDVNPGQYLEQVEEAFPTVQTWLQDMDIDLNEIRDRARDALVASGKLIAQHTFTIGQNTFAFVLDFAIMLYVAFFLLRDGDKLILLMIQALPLGDQRERLLFHKFAEVTRATVKGNIVIAVIQGALGGFILWALGIPAALLWAVVMMALSLIPAVGAGLIWGPVAIYMFAVGDYLQAVVLVLFGVLVIGLVDNILRPILVGRDTKLPDYIVLLSTLGGLVLFGINGFVIGPLIAALFTVAWGIFMREFQHEDPAETLADDKTQRDTA